jgi:hypothetical protein
MEPPVLYVWDTEKGLYSETSESDLFLNTGVRPFPKKKGCFEYKYNGSSFLTEHWGRGAQPELTVHVSINSRETTNYCRVIIHRPLLCGQRRKEAGFHTRNRTNIRSCGCVSPH